MKIINLKLDKIKNNIKNPRKGTYDKNIMPFYKMFK